MSLIKAVPTPSLFSLLYSSTDSPYTRTASLLPEDRRLNVVINCQVFDRDRRNRVAICFSIYSYRIYIIKETKQVIGLILYSSNSISTRRLVFVKGPVIVFLLSKINNMFLARVRYLNLINSIA
jgi:hypothetical protein